MRAHISSTEVASSVPFDNSTNGFTSTDVQTAIEEARNTIPYINITETSSLTSTSSTFSIIAGMATTPPAGTYLVRFNCNTQTNGVNGHGQYALFLAGSQINVTTRNLLCTTQLLGLITLSTMLIGSSIETTAIVTVDGSQTLDARYRSVNGQTITITNRDMTLLRLA